MKQYYKFSRLSYEALMHTCVSMWLINSMTGVTTAWRLSDVGNKTLANWKYSNCSTKQYTKMFYK